MYTQCTCILENNVIQTWKRQRYNGREEFSVKTKRMIFNFAKD